MKFTLFSNKGHYCFVTIYLWNIFSFEIWPDIAEHKEEGTATQEENSKYFYQFHVAGT